MLVTGDGRIPGWSFILGVESYVTQYKRYPVDNSSHAKNMGCCSRMILVELMDSGSCTVQHAEVVT